MAWIPSHTRPFASACHKSSDKTLRAAMPFGPSFDQIFSCNPRFHAWGEAAGGPERSPSVVWTTFRREKRSPSALRDRPAAVRDDKFIFIHCARRSGQVAKLRPDDARWFFVRSEERTSQQHSFSRDQHELNARTRLHEIQGTDQVLLLRSSADKPMIEHSRGFCRRSKSFVRDRPSRMDHRGSRREESRSMARSSHVMHLDWHVHTSGLSCATCEKSVGLARNLEGFGASNEERELCRSERKPLIRWWSNECRRRRDDCVRTSVEVRIDATNCLGFRSRSFVRPTTIKPDGLSPTFSNIGSTMRTPWTVRGDYDSGSQAPKGVLSYVLGPAAKPSSSRGGKTPNSRFGMITHGGVWREPMYVEICFATGPMTYPGTFY
jgi:hypothetical protein